MMKLTVYGIGCKKCEKLAEITREAVAALGLDAEVEKVQDLSQMMEAGIMSTPALALDGEVILSGRVPSLKDMKQLLG